jgi:signal transduction histidine kinase
MSLFAENRGMLSAPATTMLLSSPIVRSQARRQREMLARRHAEALDRARVRLEREIARRKAGEATIRKDREAHRNLLRTSRTMEGKLRLLTRQIISAQEEERKEISRELHDEVVQTLVGINVALASLGKGASLGLHALKAKIARTQRLVENSVNAVHRFARELRPAVLDDLGLIPALHVYSKGLALRKQLNIRMTAFAGVESLSGAKRTALFRVAQEALTNVARHANATQVRLSIVEVAGMVRMEVSDNGRSFHVGKTLAGGNYRRLGLIGMKERVAMVGGELTIDSEPGVGTTIRADVPSRRGGGRR